MFDVIPNWHPILVHFTIALLFISVCFYVLASILKKNRWHDQWLMVANWNLWIGGVFAILTAIAGWFAYNSVVHDSPSHAAMTVHRNWALATLAVFVLLAVWSLRKNIKKEEPKILFLSIAIFGAGLLMTTGWLGAESVYRYGLGVMALPQVENHGHGGGHESTTHDDSHAVQDNMVDPHDLKNNQDSQEKREPIHTDAGHEHEHGHNAHSG